ncbi:CDP-glycerol glycerophosphotransferase family protein [Micropruina sp.]|uniref:CDP-glycerol glycerophosphotransferase family protein n=1 Tax=Micropruina sp. TaxID=2737536 RepID=UPI0039E515D3
MASKLDFYKRALYHALRAVNDRPDSVVHKVYRGSLLASRRVVSMVTRKPVAWIAQLQSARWLDDHRFEITGFAFERGIGFENAAPTVRVWLQGRGGLRIPAQVEFRRDMAASARTKDSDFDYSNTGFRAVFDLSSLFAHEPVTLRTMISVSGEGRTRRGGFEKRFGGGSARFPSTRIALGSQIVPCWDRELGLQFEVRRPAAELVSGEFHGRRVELTVRGAGITGGALVNEGTSVALRIAAATEDEVRLTGELPTPVVATNSGGGHLAEDVDGQHGWLPHVWYRAMVTHSGGGTHQVASTAEECELDNGGDLTGYLLDGGLCVRDTPASLVVTSAVLETEPDLVVRVTGRVRGDVEGAQLSFVGAHQTLSVTLTLADGRFEACCPLMSSTWGRPPLPPKASAFTLRGITATGEWFWVGTDARLIDDLPQELEHELFRFRFQTDGARRLQFRVKAPRADGELGFYHQRMLEENYRKTTFEPENSIFFESFYGRSAACNPRALDALIAREHPEITRYWGVIDNSVGVPEGAVPVVYNTKAWWDARGRSRWVIANDWLRNKFKHQPHQVVLQTWHGSMFKRIGLDRPGLDKIVELALKRERNNWDLLLSQNRHSSEIFRSAYAWQGPILEEGYPRNDAMADGDGVAVRELLGIPLTDTVVLYAPTWRDDQTKAKLLLDVAALAAELGEGYTVLLRGHTRTFESSEAVTAAHLLDVTTYPDITELFLASDVLVTDYSSVMFDFSVTGRPMIFFVPDLDDYRDKIRGVYFDLEEVAPGPVIYSQELVVPAIRSAAEDRATRYADSYAAWQERFNAHDDGQSSRRVMERLFATEPPRLK